MNSLLLGNNSADFITKRNNCNCIKEAVLGTTLGDKTNNYGESYVTRLNKYLTKKNYKTIGWFRLSFID